MSRIPKWKAEKTKVKAVFRLQIHATRIPQPGWDKLFVSLIPADVGKATAKTNKANVRNGNCKWPDPIYETTRLLQDMRTKNYDDKFYKLVVAMGSSRSSLLGEVSINLANFADALKPSSVALPLHGCDFGTVLHVTIQLLSSKTGFREFEQQREISVKRFQTTSSQRNYDLDETAAAPSEAACEQIDKVNARVRLGEDFAGLPSLEEVGESNEDYADSAAGVDDSSCTSDSLYAEKNDISNAHEIDNFKRIISGDVGEFSLGQSQSPKPQKEDQHESRLYTQGSNDWTHGWSLDYSIDNDLATAYEENNTLRVRLEVAESAFLQLQMEARLLQHMTDELGAKTQNLAQQLAVELASGEQLTGEVSILKLECSKLKSDLEEIQSVGVKQQIPERSHFPPKMTYDLVDTSFDDKLGDNVLSVDQDRMLHNLQVKWIQDLLIVEGKVREIQNKACLGYHGSDFDFLHGDFEVLECVLHNLKQGIVKGLGLERSCSDYHHPEVMVYGISGSRQVFHEHEPLKKNLDDANKMEEKMSELLQKLEKSKTEKENLTKKMDQMGCYYEAFIQELEVNHNQAIKELESLKNEHSSCLYTIPVLQGQIEEMNKQLMRFAEDKNSLESHSKELERRAMVSENALKRVHQKYSVAVDRLQKDLELLSFQVLSMYETNENLAKQAFGDAPQLFYEDYPEETSEEARSCMYKDHVSTSFHQEQYKPVFTRIQAETGSTKADLESSQTGMSTNVEVQPKDEAYVNGFTLENFGHDTLEHDIISVKKDLVFCGDLSPERKRDEELPEKLISHKSKHDLQLPDNAEPVQTCSETGDDRSVDANGIEKMGPSFHKLKELFLQTEVELSEMHMSNMHREVFSDVLQGTLCDVYDGIRYLKGKMVELVQHLEHSTAIKESLMLKLANSLDEARVAREDEAKCIRKCDDLSMKNQNLEAKLEDVSKENNFLAQKISEYEKLMLDYRVYESKFKAFSEERKEFENLLKEQSLQKSSLQNEISSMIDDFKALKEAFDHQSSVNVDLQKTVTYLQGKLANLGTNLIHCNEKINGSAFDGTTLQQDLENKNYFAVFICFEQFQQEACKKILQFIQEKKEMEKQREIAKLSLHKTESQMLHMKQKFESDLEEITKKQYFSNTLVEKLQLELQNVEEKLKISSEVEEKNVTKNRELSSKFAVLEIELQHATDENRDLARKLLVYGSVREELERTKISLMNCMQEKTALMMSIQSGNEASVQIENELRSLKETLQCTHQDLQIERELREEFEATVTNLSSQLTEKDQRLLSFEEQQSELGHLRKKVSDIETANIGLQNLLLQNEENRRKVEDENLFFHLKVADMENHLEAILENSLAAEFKAMYMRSQFHTRMQELVGQLQALERDLRQLRLKHTDAKILLETHIASKAQLADENAKLSTTLQLLKSEFETIVCEKEGLVECINKYKAICTEDEDKKASAATMEVDSLEKYEDEIWQLKNMVVNFEEEVDNLKLSGCELEIMDIILRSKWDEQRSQISLLEEFVHELGKLREQNYDLSYKLSEQILKTEEFKNLSIHLRELKDKADAECHQACEKRETEESSFAMQESLRIAFIKEQYESTLQELRNQLHISKKYAEEMLLKLQNALDEVESKKKNEVALANRVEELSKKILDLEIELQTVLTDRRELDKAYDRMKAELECAMLSLDCCKEEKLMLETSLQECSEERTLVKQFLENMTSLEDFRTQGGHESVAPNVTSIGQLLGDSSSGSGLSAVSQEAQNSIGLCSGKDTAAAASMDPLDNVDTDKLLTMSCMLSLCGDLEDVQPAWINENSHLSHQLTSQAIQDSKSALEPEVVLKRHVKDIADFEKHVKERQRLKAGMDLLQKELENLKNENLSSLLPLEDHHFDPSLRGLQSELSQLEMANEHLGSIFPSFKELPGSGNALERVLAFELELAEEFQLKEKSDICFQSSFFKQHNDKAAIFQSFRDINELIHDMLEVKQRHAALETELKEMQGRFLQLSLHFAEVEGERQKLVMTLKNRVPKKS
ncbi:centromere-associated protein E [Cocos nucifera]|uniref:Centromere-associated protein E n=1 Tax=Cocos nucifera TaxID=13894 RepID=A0A8K0HZG5_COCNU|nr:centromere-associated protein E [Cocos nucifera]